MKRDGGEDREMKDKLERVDKGRVDNGRVEREAGRQGGREAGREAGRQ